MLRDTAVNLIARRLGNRTDLNDSIIAELQFVQELLENREYLPWFLLSELASTSTVADEERLALPSDFLMEYEQGALWYYSASSETKWTPLVKRPIEDLKGAFDSSGAPQYYALANGYFRLGPVPDAVYNIKMLYYKRDEGLDTNIENNWLKYAPALMVAMTGVQVATYIQNERMIQVFAAALQRAEVEFYNALEARKHANMDYQMEFK
jgi:hypothetical protein